MRSHLSVNHLAQLLRDGGRPAGPPPVPSLPFTGPVEVDRTVSTAGTVSLGQHLVLAAEILAGRRVSICVDEHTLMFLRPRHPRTASHAIQPAQARRDRAAALGATRRPPQASTGPVSVERRASNSGVVMLVGQKIALGRVCQRTTEVPRSRT